MPQRHADGPGRRIRSGLRRAVRTADAQRRTCIANGFDQVDSQRVDWADASSWLDPVDVVVCADCVYAPEAIEPLANCIAHHLAEGGVVYAFSAERDWSDASTRGQLPATSRRLVNVGL